MTRGTRQAANTEREHPLDVKAYNARKMALSRARKKAGTPVPPKLHARNGSFAPQTLIFLCNPYQLEETKNSFARMLHTVLPNIELEDIETCIRRWQSIACTGLTGLKVFSGVVYTVDELEGVCSIELFGTDYHHQGQKLGKAVMEDLLSKASAKMLKMVLVAADIQSVGFYTKMGFTEKDKLNPPIKRQCWKKLQPHAPGETVLMGKRLLTNAGASDYSGNNNQNTPSSSLTKPLNGCSPLSSIQLSSSSAPSSSSSSSPQSGSSCPALSCSSVQHAVGTSTARATSSGSSITKIPRKQMAKGSRCKNKHRPDAGDTGANEVEFLRAVQRKPNSQNNETTKISTTPRTKKAMQSGNIVSKHTMLNASQSMRQAGMPGGSQTIVEPLDAIPPSCMLINNIEPLPSSPPPKSARRLLGTRAMEVTKPIQPYRCPRKNI